MELAENNNEGAIILPTEEHWVYAGPSVLEVSELKAAIQDTSQWKGGDGRAEFDPSGGATAKPIIIGFLSTLATWLVMTIWAIN